MYRTFPIFPWISAVSIDEPPQAPVPQGRDPRRRGVQRLLRALVYGIEPSVEVWDFNGGLIWDLMGDENQIVQPSDG